MKAVTGLVSSKGDAQRVVVDNAAEALDAVVVVVAEAGFPVPGLQVIAELTQVAVEAAGEEVVIRVDLVRAQTGFETHGNATPVVNRSRAARH